jgi:hypothetical protein
MTVESTLDRLLANRSSEELYHAARAYLSERLGHPAIGDLEADLGRLAPDLPELAGQAAADDDELYQAAVAVFAEAWDDPAERSRVEAALKVHTDRMTVTDPYPIAVLIMYALYLFVGRTEREEVHRTGTTSHTIREKGPLAFLRGALIKEKPADGLVALGRSLPGEGHFSIAVLDIQNSSRLIEDGTAPAARQWLTGTVGRAMNRLGISEPHLQPGDRGDGWQLVIDEAAIGLSTLVRDLPPLIAGPLAGYRHDHPEPLKVRLALHTDHLRATANGWDGYGLNEAARIVDAKEVKRQLAANDHRLATVLSDRVYRALTFHRRPADGYTPVGIKINGVRTKIWVALG